MGVCDSNNNKPNYYKVPGIQHIQAEGNPETHGYKFNFTEKQANHKTNRHLFFFSYERTLTNRSGTLAFLCVHIPLLHAKRINEWRKEGRA